MTKYKIDITDENGRTTHSRFIKGIILLTQQRYPLGYNAIHILETRDLELETYDAKLKTTPWGRQCIEFSTAEGYLEFMLTFG